MVEGMAYIGSGSCPYSRCKKCDDRDIVVFQLQNPIIIILLNMILGRCQLTEMNIDEKYNDTINA